MPLTLLRILLVVSLVFWSPAWCCCAVRAAAAGASDSSDSALPPCCAARASVETAASAGRHCRLTSAIANCPDGEHESSCTCDQRDGDERRLDTSSSIANPRPHDMPVAIAMRSLATTASMPAGRLHRLLLEAVDRPPPLLTLMHQHVLHLI